MNSNFKDALDNIHAEDTLKNNTKAFLAEKTKGYHKRPHALPYRRLASIAACFLFVLVLLGGGWAYFTPISVISIDINPSLELGVNRFDKVVFVKGYNEDGKALAKSLNIRFVDYTKALERVLDNESIADYLSQNEILSITVAGANEEHCSKMLSNIEACTAGHTNTYCHSGDYEKTKEAHAAGLSCGKYRALLELQALDSSITAEDVQGMTMEEIWSLLQKLSEERETQGKSENGNGNGFSNENQGGSTGGHHEEPEHGYGYGHGHGHGY